MDTPIVERLALRYMFGMLHRVPSDDGVVAIAGPDEVEADGRKRKKAVADAVADGFLYQLPGTNRLSITDKAFSLIPEHSVNLANVWRERHVGDGRWNPRHTWAFIRPGMYSLHELLIGQLKTVLAAPDKYRWYVADATPLRYSNYTFNCVLDQEGPFKLAEARLVLESKQRNRDGDHEIVVSDDDLEQYVPTFIFDQEVEETYPKSLAWGLVQTGILHDVEAELVDSGDSFGSGLCLSGRSTYMGRDPLGWGDRVEAGTDNAINDLVKLHERLRILRKIQVGVTEHGGWTVFRNTVKDALVKALREQEKQTEVANV